MKIGALILAALAGGIGSAASAQMVAWDQRIDPAKILEAAGRATPITKPVTSGVRPPVSAGASIGGRYDCVDGSDDSPAGTLSIDAKKATVEARKGDQTLNGTLADKSELLSPLEKELGFMLVVIIKDGDAVADWTILKTRNGGVLISERSGGFSRYSLPEDRSRSKDMEVSFKPNVVCAPAR